jgi:ABC-type Fe3+-siderophore transport system permease subunit
MEGVMSLNNRDGQIDSSRIPVEGAAGLGLVVMAAIVIYALAPLRTGGVAALLGGLVVGLSLLAIRHKETRPYAIGGMVLAAIALAAVIVTWVIQG